jgi:hypothetical protein
MTDVKYLAIDPGETSGWAQFDAQGNAIAYGQFKLKDVKESLQRLVSSDLLAVIVEDYKVHPWQKQRGFSRNETSKIIGRIEMICELRNIKMVLQPNTVRAIGYKWAGLDEQPTNHAISHQFDAVAHGVYWLQMNGIRPVGKAITSGNQESSTQKESTENS